MIAGTGTLFRYISRHFLFNFLGLTLILLGLVYVFDTIELLRRAADRPGVPFGLVLSMAAMKLPMVGQQIIPFAVLFAAIYTCWRLNKTSELVVIRAAGLSAWQFLAPMIACAFGVGLLTTMAINPIGSIMLSKYAQMEIVHLQKTDNLVTVSRTGIWLRQPAEDNGYALLHAENFEQKEWRLGNVIVLFFDADDTFQKRIDSPSVLLKDGFWDMQNALINTPTGASRQDLLALPTELTAEKIEESFADPETISFWQIPQYLRIMTETGFPGTRLAIHFQSLLAQPFLLAAMILLAATFSLRPQRIGGTALMITLGVAVGFFIFFMESILQAFGISQKIPVSLAAWTPALVSLLLGTTALLHMEDG